MRAAPRSAPYDPARVVWAPQPGPQTRLLQCPATDVLYGGSPGSAKTDGLIGDWLQHAFDPVVKGRATGLLARLTFPELRQIQTRCEELFPQVGGVYHGGEKLWAFGNGAKLYMGFLESTKDAGKYQGWELTWFGFDEIGNLPDPAPADMISARLRSKYGVQTWRRSTANPMGPGHAWLKARYVDPAKPGQIFEFHGSAGQVIGTRCYIPARFADNPILARADPTYLDRVRQSGRSEIVRAWIEGIWDVDPERSLFKRQWFDAGRVDAMPCEIRACVVAVDLAKSNTKKSNETGYAVAALGEDNVTYLLADDGIVDSPDARIRLGSRLYHHWGCGALVLEDNAVGDFGVQSFTDFDPTLNVRTVTASRSKWDRADPVAALVERGEVRMVGYHPELEDQCCVFQGLPSDSDDRLDAFVWAVTYLKQHGPLPVPDGIISIPKVRRESW